MPKTAASLLSPFGSTRQNRQMSRPASRVSSAGLIATSARLTPSADHIARLPEIQKSIYGGTGKSLASVSDSPSPKVFSEKGFETLLLVDPINEYAVTQLKEFDGEELARVSEEGLELEEMEDGDKARQDEARQFEDLCEAIKDALGNKVEVVVSNRITDSLGVLVASQFGWSSNMERIMKAPALLDFSMSSYMASEKTLELNLNAFINELKKKVAEDKADKSVCNLQDRPSHLRLHPRRANKLVQANLPHDLAGP